MRGRSAVIAVVDSTEDLAIVWWVNAEDRPQESMSRLCGAWKLPHDSEIDRKLDGLVFDRIVLATSAGEQLLLDSGIAARRVFNPNESLAIAVAEKDRLQLVFDLEQDSRPKSRKLRVPTWPTFPDPIDIESPSSWKRGETSVPESEKAIAIAYWVSHLCDRWEDLEEQRLSRAWLAKQDGVFARPLPIVVASK